MREFRKILLTALIGALTLAGCSAPTQPDPGAAQGPTAIPTLQDACKTAETFLTAWNKKDYPAMYSLITGKAQALALNAFTAIYEQTEKEINAQSKTHTLDCEQAIQQGTTAVITYDMKFRTAILGEFDDNRRVMRLVLTPNGWRVAWSTMDIFEGLSADSRLTLESTPLERGTIFDRNDKPLAQDKQVLYTARLLTLAYPTGNPDDCFRAIAITFKRRFVDVQKQYSGLTGKDYGEYVGNLDEPTYNSLRANLDRVCRFNWSSHTTRVYRGNGLAAQMLGYIGLITAAQQEKYLGYPQGALVGQIGLEEKYERQLAGVANARLIIRSSTGTVIREVRSQAGKPGQSIFTTLDGDLQLAVEQAMSDAYNYAQPSWAQFSTGAAAIVMKPYTGEILAMANYPTFDVDTFNPTSYLASEANIARITIPGERSPLRNRVSQEYSALASVMKVISTTAAADSGVFKANQTVTCTGVWNGAKYGDTQNSRTDWIYLDDYYKKQGKNFHGSLNLIQALAASCDPYYWEIGGQLNAKDPAILPGYAIKMGLGNLTGITDMPELKGQIPGPDNIANITRTEGRRWSPADALNIVIGQGDVQVTPLQVARMMNGIVNGGQFYKPYFVSSVGSKDAPTYRAQPELQGTMGIDPKVLESVRKGLCMVTQDKDIGTAHWFLSNWRHDKVQLCGKTGTAQTGSPYPNGWFVAYAGLPGKEPDIVIVVLVERGREGSETAGPIVRRIVESYYKIPYNEFPRFWQENYVPLADPNKSDGGRH
jgi:penicillin-binding protein 2